MTPVRAILGYQEIIVEVAQRLQLDDILPTSNQVLDAAVALSGLVDRIFDAKSEAEIDAGEMETKASGHDFW